MVMTKEKFKKYIKDCGGIQDLIEFREQLMELVLATDEVIELEAKIDSVEFSEVEIFMKVFRMVGLMDEYLE